MTAAEYRAELDKLGEPVTGMLCGAGKEARQQRPCFVFEK
jgi:hypothetical protein